MKYSLEVAMLMLVALAAVEAAVRAVPNAYKMKNEAMERHSRSVETLVLGNSHGYYDIMPSGLGSNCYNLAMVSQTLEYDYLLLTKYDFSHLKRVVLVVDNSNCFDMPLDKSQEWYRCTFYRLYMGCGQHGLMSKYGFELSNVPAARKKVERYAEMGRVLTDSLGWGEDFDTQEAGDNPRLNADYSKDRANKHSLRSYSDYAENKAWLLRMARWCKMHGVALDIVSAPVWKNYRDNISPRQTALLAEAVREALVCGADVWHDFTADPRFVAMDFYDCDHLSHAGAEKFTKILKLALDAQSRHCKSDTSR